MKIPGSICHKLAVCDKCGKHCEYYELIWSQEEIINMSWALVICAETLAMTILT